MSGATHLYAIAIGSNRRHVRHGRPAGVVEAAIARLDADFGLYDASPIILNKAMGGAGRDFANAVALVESDLAPIDMLAALKAMEREFGRRSGRRWGERVLDLDIADWNGGRFSCRTLQIPHTQISKRRFVIDPMSAVAGNWPIQPGLKVRHLRHRLTKRKEQGREV